MGSEMCIRDRTNSAMKNRKSSYHESYNPRVGRGPGGFVNKDDFSIDGKSWAYRDPDNYNDNDSEWSSSRDTYNSNAYDFTNPLYDYSYGQARDAAEALGIGNVNKQEEVDQLLAYMKGDRPSDDAGKEISEPEPEPEPLPSPTNEGAVKSPRLAYAQDFTDQYLADMASGASSIFSDDYRSTGEALAQRGITPPNATFDTPIPLTSDETRNDYGDEGLDLSRRDKTAQFLDGYLNDLVG